MGDHNFSISSNRSSKVDKTNLNSSKVSCINGNKSDINSNVSGINCKISSINANSCNLSGINSNRRNGNSVVSKKRWPTTNGADNNKENLALGIGSSSKGNLNPPEKSMEGPLSPAEAARSHPEEEKGLANADDTAIKLEKAHRLLGRINGSLKRMGLCELKQMCRDLGLDSRGKRQTVIRRLKEHHRIEHLVAAGVMERREDASAERNSDYFVVVDFEATCEEKNPIGYPHEIIEFPAVLVSSRRKAVVDTFHRFVRPTVNPVLSEFCRSLTGISQEKVEAADTFDQVHADFLAWMAGHGLGADATFTMVTDGPFDMGRFLHLQCLQSGIPYPVSYASHWANIRKSFANFYREEFFASKGGSGSSPNKLPSLKDMLEALELTFEGTPHHGIDDARNIARILTYLLKDHAFIWVNEKIARLEAAAEDGGSGGGKKLAPCDDRTPWAKLSNVVSVPRWKAEALLNEEKQRIMAKLSSP